MQRVKLSLDAMGGDLGPAVVVQAALAALNQHADLSLTLVGDETQLKAALAKVKDVSNRLDILHCDQLVTMHDKPTHALRSKTDSSMYQALNLVREQLTHACVSAGNTGALMLMSRQLLKTLPGIERPAIAAPLPTSRGHTYVLDLGGNVDANADNLLQFAVMGSILVSALSGRERPRVSLLNIGHELSKGTDLVRAAHALLHESPFLNYQGFIEGHGIFQGQTDVVVTDGFVGNVALKTSEGLALMLGRSIQQAFRGSLWRRLVGALALPLIRDTELTLNTDRYNGATLLGLRATVIKSHGAANTQAMTNAISRARQQVEQAVPDRISQMLSEVLTGK